MVVIGGLGNFSGTMVGALFLTILPEYLRRFEFLFKYRMIAYGLVLVIVMWINHSIPGTKLKNAVTSRFNALLHRKNAEAQEA